MHFDEDLLDVSKKLKERFTSMKITLSGAESCTGGLVGGVITALAGSSDYFMGSAVTYSNEAKMDILGVQSDLLNIYGAVSPNCAEAMAVGARKVYHSTVSFSVTGVAGPDGGSEDKPVGTVWFGLSSNLGTRSFKKVFPGDRGAVRSASVREIMSVLLDLPLKMDL